MGAIESYKWKIDRQPVSTFLEMCYWLDRYQKENAELKTQVTQLNRRNEVQAGIIEDEGKRTPEEIDEIDRNARAFGWEIGHGAILVGGTICTSDDNPFLSKDWKKEMGFE